VSLDNPMVRFDNVQKSYDGKTLVVKNLDVDIAKGEFLTMLGPSGSGKTTSLMMLAGFEPATHGEIYLNGKPINNVPPNKRGIGMVFQTSNSVSQLQEHLCLSLNWCLWMNHSARSTNNCVNRCNTR